MTPLRILTCFMLIFVSGAAWAQVDGYTCVNEYLDCGDVVESEDYTFQIYNAVGWPGDTIWLPVGLPVGWGATPDTIEAFAFFIGWDSTYLDPLTDPADSTVVQHRRHGLFESVEGGFFAILSQNPADENAIGAFYNLSADSVVHNMPPGGYGTMFSLGFVVKPNAPPNDSSLFYFHEVNEYVVIDSAAMDAFCADCRRANIATKHDCEVHIYDTVSVDPLIIDTLLDTASCSSVVYPMTVEGYFTPPPTECGEIYLSGVDGLVDGDIPIMGGSVKFHFALQNRDPDEKLRGIVNGMVLSGTGDVTWSAEHGWEWPFYPWDAFNYWLETEFSWDGQGADTVGFKGVAHQSYLPGIPAGYHGPAVYVEVAIHHQTEFEGETFCIDSSYYPPDGHWLWIYPDAIDCRPDWSGPYCFDLTLAEPPFQFVDPPVSYTGSHCDLVVLDYMATSSDSSPLDFTNECGFGTVTQTGDSTCQFTYQPTLADVGAGLVVVIGVSNVINLPLTTETELTITNEAPVFTGGCGQTGVMGLGNTGCITVSFDDVDCDPSTMSIVGVNPAPVGNVYLDGDRVCFASDAPGDGGIYYTVTLQVSDSVDASSCEVYFAAFGEAFEVQIDKIHNSLQGMHTTVNVIQTKGSEDMGGWDFLIAYDASALNLQAAIPGQLHEVCEWEYFNYRCGPFGNCGNQCPSGLVRVVAIAETNNGPHHPICKALPKPTVLFSLDFLVSDDRTLECQYAPIRFFWMDCGDNGIAYHPVDNPLAAYLAVSRFVVDYDQIGHIEDMSSGFPTYTGVQWECLQNDPDKPTPIQYVDFVNGGVDIICADSIDDRGDVNLNGTANEIADAVLFSNYFVEGLPVFNVNVAGQIAATDVNADGLTLSVADLVYLIRVIVGDALPYPKVTPVPTSYAFENGVLSVDGRMGAALAVFADEVTPILLADDMEMRYRFDGAQTRVLVFNIKAGASFEGAFLQTEGELVSLEMATYDGAPVLSKLMPSEYRLYQNYPNPFNPRTNIAFSLPGGGDYHLTVYNVTGREVASFSGTAEVGKIETVTFDGSDLGSGVYFYRLESEEFSQSRKMVLLK